MNKIEIVNELERLIREASQIAPSISNLQGNPNYSTATDEALKFQASQRWESEAAALISKLAGSQAEVFLGLKTQYECLKEESKKFHSRSILIHKVILLLETAKDLLNSNIAAIESPVTKTMGKAEVSPPEKVTIPWLFKHVPIPLMFSAVILLVTIFMAGFKSSQILLVQEALGFAGPAIPKPMEASAKPDQSQLQLAAYVFGKNENNKTVVLKDIKEINEKNASLFSSTKSSVRILTVHGASWLKDIIVWPNFEKALKVASVELLVINPLGDSYKYLNLSNTEGIEREYSFHAEQLRLNDMKRNFDFYRETFSKHENAQIRYYAEFPWIRFTVFDDSDAIFVLTPFIRTGTESTVFHTTDPWIIKCLEKIYEEFKANSKSLKSDKEYENMWTEVHNKRKK